MKHIPFLLTLAIVASGFAKPTNPEESFLRIAPDSISSASDGRQGFIIGIGLGFGLTNLSTGGSSNSDAGLAVDFKIGHAPSDQLAIYITGKGSSVPSKAAGTTTIVGVACIGGTYFFQPDAPSPFASFGLGGSFIRSDSDFGSTSISSTNQGFGVFFGGGYEFARHWSAELDLMLGSPKSGSSYFGFMITINVLSW